MPNNLFWKKEAKDERHSQTKKEDISFLDKRGREDKQGKPD
jgi:hypothetical protein